MENMNPVHTTASNGERIRADSGGIVAALLHSYRREAQSERKRWLRVRCNTSDSSNKHRIPETQRRISSGEPASACGCTFSVCVFVLTCVVVCEC
jgi:hypothetical protein